ncbi:hypothetical protein MBLNU230_g3569t1 [Neophaeotheca triangularis]
MASTAPLPAPLLYPTPSEAALKAHYVGQNIQNVQAPAVILDQAVIRRNCNLMLETTSRLGLGFRAHVKTHKTTELTKLQLGPSPKAVNLIVSTVAEAENLLPLLLSTRTQNPHTPISLLYGLPATPSSLPRLANIASKLGPNSLALFVDHPAHIKHLETSFADPSHPWPGDSIPVFVKIDTGYHRAGVTAGSGQLADVAYALAASEVTHVKGFYAHMGHSYGAGSVEEAVAMLGQELRGVEEAAVAFLKCGGERIGKRAQGKVCLSLGATPTATAAQNFLTEEGGGPVGAQVREVRELVEHVNRSFEVELHAGVYPVMDMQQMATRARPRHVSGQPGETRLDYADLGLRTLVEVASVYEERGKPEAVVAAGSIVLGREPCKSYPGFGVVTPFPQALKGGTFYDPEAEGEREGWIVNRVSQEHGILSWEGSPERKRELAIGDKLLIWPNHACIAGVNFGWYLVVDSESEDPLCVRDVWVRWRGW